MFDLHVCALPAIESQHDPPDSIPVTLPIAYQDTPLFDEDLGMTSQYRQDPVTQEIFVSVYFKSCVINKTSREIILVNRFPQQSVPLFLEIPLQDWENGLQDSLCTGLPWQYYPDLSRFPRLQAFDFSPHFLKTPGIPDPPIGFYFGRVRNLAQAPVFRPTPPESATHALLKLDWHVPDSAIDRPTGQVLDAATYLDITSQTSPAYIETLRTHFHPGRFLRAASLFFPRGVDYLLLPITE